MKKALLFAALIAIALSLVAVPPDQRPGPIARSRLTDWIQRQIFKIDLAGAVDITDMDGLTATTHLVAKSAAPFLDVVAVLTAPPMSLDPTLVPSQIEGIALGPDVYIGKARLHTPWVANDNDFEATVPDANGNTVDNPRQFFVFGFTDADLNGSKLVPQQFKSFRW